MYRHLGGLALLATLAAGPVAAAETHVPQELANVDGKTLEDSVRYMTGNVIYVLFHEAGHMLVSELDLPVLGREEDAVDTLSSVLLLEAKDKVLDQALIDSVDSWLSLGNNYGTPQEEDFMDTHGLDKQRAYNIACMMVGQDQQRFKDFADRLKLPQSRRDECEGEYQRARDSWFSVLKPYMADDNEKIKFKLAYYKTKDRDLDFYRGLLKEAGTLEMLRDTFSGLIRLKDGIKLTATTCGQANAFWNPSDRELTYCYEDARSYVQTFTAAGEKAVSEDATAGDDSEESTDDQAATDDDQSEDDSAAQADPGSDGGASVGMSSE